MDFEEDHFNSGDMVEYASEEDTADYAMEEDFDYCSGGGGDTEEDTRRDDGEKKYKILNEDDIRQLQENHISTVSSLLWLSRGSACALLCRKNWSLSFFVDEWFANDTVEYASEEDFDYNSLHDEEDTARDDTMEYASEEDFDYSSGYPVDYASEEDFDYPMEYASEEDFDYPMEYASEEDFDYRSGHGDTEDTARDDERFADDDTTREHVVKQSQKNQVCKICYDEMDDENMVSVAACGHPFCADCWKTYITTSINDGPGCLALRCPMPRCKSHVGLDIVDMLVSGDDRDKYYQYLVRSYVELNRRTKWCPAPGCNLAIEFDDGDYTIYDVTCGCSHRFCWNCTEESHRPVSCEVVAKWTEKNNSEEENKNWILAYTKPCPKCKTPIEKNQGCSHITCKSPCWFDFCWECLGAWKTHTSLYDCNMYKEWNGKNDEKSRMNAKEHLERYTHYYERWDSNAKSRRMALLHLNRVINEHIPILCDMQESTYSQLKFVIEAWEQIVECKRVLKWTHAYGYYLCIEEDSLNKTHLFEYLQGEAEAALERLHRCAEKDIEKYLHSFQKDFSDYQSNLSCITAATKNYFKNFVEALENNLSEVQSGPSI